MTDETKQDKSWALDGNENTWSLLDEEGRRIALIDKGAFDAASRARMICAAPKLLAALQKIVNNWDNLHPKDRQQARNAMAKAGGRSK